MDARREAGQGSSGQDRAGFNRGGGSCDHGKEGLKGTVCKPVPCHAPCLQADYYFIPMNKQGHIASLEILEAVNYIRST